MLGLPRGGVVVAAEVAAAVRRSSSTSSSPASSPTPSSRSSRSARWPRAVRPVWDEAMLRRMGLRSDRPRRRRRGRTRGAGAPSGDLPAATGRHRTCTAASSYSSTTVSPPAPPLGPRCGRSATEGAARLVLAVPVAAPESLADVHRRRRGRHVAGARRNFGAVGRWYDDFSQLTDEDVRRALAPGRRELTHHQPLRFAQTSSSADMIEHDHERRRPAGRSGSTG